MTTKMRKMENSNHLLHLNYSLNKQELLESADAAISVSEAYTDSRYPELKLDDWKISRYTDSAIEKVIKDFEVEGRPRFYWLKPFAVIPEHTDNETQCSINIILSEDPAPITIQGQNFYYNQALLDTTVPHSVVNGPEERIMLKISIFNESFQELRQRIKYKL